jgi:4-hydroxy-tetrahydrodipicolinate synthase
MSAFARAPKLGPLMTAMLTPFDASDNVDFKEARRLARFLVDEGNDGLIVCGTTGEAPAMTELEQLTLFEEIKREVGHRAAVVAGTGSNSTSDTITFTKQAEAVGVDAALVVVPYYNKPTQGGMLAHFGAVADATALPIVVYNIPARTGVNMLPATLLELARRHKNIVGVKESTGDCAQFTAILRDRPSDFAFWSGDDHMLLPALALGGDGIVSVAAHLCARELRELIDTFARGDAPRAGQIHRDLSPLVAALFATSSPIPVKWAMNELGFALGPCRPPIGEMTTDVAELLGPLLEPYRARCASVTTLH